MNLFYDTFKTAFGAFSAAVDEHGALVATAFGDAAVLAGRIRGPAPKLTRDRARLKSIEQQLVGYLAGRQRSFSLPLAAGGSPFQQRVWSELQAIPFGETRSYGDLARKLKSSPRAVGRANATNPICLIVPCHRVVGADGSLTGFAFGEKIKQQLLEHEGAR
jgi:methylated-DNA-[protein]-cysteine S-methyltransferase